MHVTSFRCLINAKRSREQKQKPVTKVPEKRNKVFPVRDDPDRISSESDDYTMLGFPEIAHRSPLSTLKGDNVNYAEFGAIKIYVVVRHRKIFTCGRCN